MGTNPSNFKGNKRPVEQVSWDDCLAFIDKLNAATGKTFRLPTEAEWEYAARGGNKSKSYKYAGSNNIKSVAWFAKNSLARGKNSQDYGTHEVATKHPNELGLYDISGNVDEWCHDWYGSYSNTLQTNPKGPNGGRGRVLRGGSWRTAARNCRSSVRGDDNPSGRCSYLGLRLVLSE
jgi:formylglycine-generating enzyme required for sulfatase activity